MTSTLRVNIRKWLQTKQKAHQESRIAQDMVCVYVPRQSTRTMDSFRPSDLCPVVNGLQP